jgi:hypothetical protein
LPNELTLTSSGASDVTVVDVARERKLARKKRSEKKF